MGCGIVIMSCGPWWYYGGFGGFGILMLVPGMFWSGVLCESGKWHKEYQKIYYDLHFVVFIKPVNIMPAVLQWQSSCCIVNNLLQSYNFAADGTLFL